MRREADSELLVMWFLERQSQHLTKALWLPANISFPFGLLWAPANFRICMHTTWVVYLRLFAALIFHPGSTVEYSCILTQLCGCTTHWWIPHRGTPKLLRGYLKGPLLSSVLLSSQCYLCVKRQNSAQQNTSAVKPLYFTCQSRWVISWPEKAKCGVCSTIIITEEAPLVLC